MATLASKLKRKMDREKTKFPEKKVCKLNEASTSELDDDTTIADNNCPKSNASKNLEEWKREKEILREKMLIENRAYIEKRMPQEVNFTARSCAIYNLTVNISVMQGHVLYII